MRPSDVQDGQRSSPASVVRCRASPPFARHDDEVEALTGIGGKDDRASVGRPRRIALDRRRLRPERLAVAAVGRESQMRSR